MNEEEKAGGIKELDNMMKDAATQEIHERIAVYSLFAALFAFMGMAEEERQSESVQAEMKQYFDNVIHKINMLAGMLPQEELQKMLTYAGKNVVVPGGEGKPN